MALAALHEVAGGGHGATDGAAAALFAAGIAARLRGRVLWCLTRQDLFAPALAQAGLMPDRVIYVEAGDEKSVLICFEEGLRHGGLGAVVAEVASLSMTASRRLQLAAEGSGTIGLAIRRWRRPAEAADFGQPTASVTRWHAGASARSPQPRCLFPALDAPGGSSNCSGAAPGEAPISKWRPAMPRVVSRVLPAWSTDRLRRTLGGAAPPAVAPLVLSAYCSRRPRATIHKFRLERSITPDSKTASREPASAVRKLRTTDSLMRTTDSLRSKK